MPPLGKAYAGRPGHRLSFRPAQLGGVWKEVFTCCWARIWPVQNHNSTNRKLECHFLDSQQNPIFQLSCTLPSSARHRVVTNLVSSGSFG